VFLSYSRADQAFAREITAALAARGKDVWVDWEDIEPSADWWQRIERAIEAARAFVAVISPEQVASAVCARELDAAGAANKRVVPILRRDVDPAGLPPALARPNWILARGSDDLESAVERLVEALDTDLDWTDRHARLLVRAREWEREGRNASFLLRGEDLKAAEAWLAQQGAHDQVATPLQGEYVLTSRRASTRRQRITLVAVMLALAVSTGLAVVAFILRGQAIDRERTARSRELAVSAGAQLDVDPELSVILARDAVELSPTAEAVSTLRRAVAAAFGRDRRQLRVRPAFAAFSHDGSRLVTVERNGTTVGWTLPDLHRTSLSQKHRADELLFFEPGAIFSADGRIVAVRVANGSAVIRRAHDWRVIDRWRGGTTRVVADGVSGSFVTVMARDRVVLRRRGRPPLTLEPDEPVRENDDVAIAPGGRAIMSVARPLFPRRRVYVVAMFWHPPWKRPFTLENRRSPAFSPDGRSLLLLDPHCAVEIRDGRTGRLRRRVVLARAGGCVEQNVFSGDGLLVASALNDGDLVIWRVTNDELVSYVRGPGGALSAVEFSRDHAKLLTTGGGAVRVWEVSSGRQLAALRGQHDNVVAAQFSADGRSVSTVSTGGVLRRFRLPVARQLITLPTPVTELMRGDGRLFAAAATKSPEGEGPAFVHQFRRHRGGLRLLRPPVPVDGCCAAMAGRYAVVYVGLIKSVASVALIDLDGKRIHPPLAGTEVGFSPDGRFVAVGFDHGRIRVWRIRPWQLVGSIRFPNVVAGGRIALAPEGKRLFVELRDSGEGGIWDVATKRQLANLTPVSAVDAAVFSHDGKYLAYEQGSRPRILDAETGSLFEELLGSESHVDDLAFSDDDALLLSASTDGIAHVHDVQTGATILAVTTRFRDYMRAAFWPDSHSIAASGFKMTPDGYTTGSNDIAVFDCDACGTLRELKTVAAKRIMRPLSRFERHVYLHRREMNRRRSTGPAFSTRRRRLG
jgi:WD40 repeat protein